MVTGPGCVGDVPVPFSMCSVSYQHGYIVNGRDSETCELASMISDIRCHENWPTH
jgi:hypothetical protein